MVSKYSSIAFTPCCVCVLILIEAFFSACVFADGLQVKAPSKLQQELYTSACDGKLSDSLVQQFFDYAERQAKLSGKGSEGFRDWISRHDTVRKGLLVGMHPDYNPEVIVCLSKLYDKFPAELEKYGHLGLAFAFVFGQAGEGTIRGPNMDWVAKDRDIPSMEESFGYYVKYSKLMLMPLDKLEWPLLLFVADNDVPINERKWVLLHYKGRTLESLSRVHGDPHYVTGKKIKKILGMPGYSMALPRILSDGGVCSQQSYYASRVFKSLGVPSNRLGIPGHVFEGRVSGYPKMTVKYGLSKGRGDGGFFCPLSRTRKKQYEFEMLVSAMNLPYEKYLRALAGNHIFTLLPDELKKDGVGLLDEAIKCNPYCTENWLTITKLCKNGVISADEGWKYIKKARIFVANQPDLACGMIEAIWEYMIDASITDPSSKTRWYISRLRRTVIWLDNFKRPELSEKVTVKLKDYLSIAKGKFGTVYQEVVSVKSLQAGSFVWEVLPEMPEWAKLNVSVKHAAAGSKGAFHIVAWADTDGDNVPDKQISISPLLEAKEKDEWSSWEFSARHNRIFVGIAQKTDTDAYYKIGGKLEGYCGLSSRVCYSRKFGTPPQKTKRPRYLNVHLEITNTGL